MIARDRLPPRIARPPATLLASLLLALLAPGAAWAASVEPAQPVVSPPQLLLIHGGSFLFEDPFFRPETEAAAVAAGFTPHYLRYPLGDLPAAYRVAREAARQLRDAYGSSVYAYGSSAGGMLAALLAGDGLVAAAVAKAPPSDLPGWQWPLAVYGPDYYERLGVGPAASRRLSPARRPARRPLLVVQGRLDRVVPLAMSEAFAARFRRVHLWAVPGGHWTERRRPWVLERALGWLAGVAAVQSGRAEKPVPGRPTRASS